MKRFALPITLFFIAGCAMIILRVPGLLDSRIYYSAEEARLFLTQLSPHMAQTYFWHCLWDFLFMFSYTWLLWLRLATPWALLPGMIDIGETSLILMALKTGDAPYTLMSLFTLGKWAGFVLLAVRSLSRVHVNRKKN